MNFPSVTGRNAQVPYALVDETILLAFCKVSVSFPTKHSKIVPVMLPKAMSSKQPTVAAKA